ncbi:hypothetical protein U6M95_12475 [Cutibacterium acnes]
MSETRERDKRLNQKCKIKKTKVGVLLGEWDGEEEWEVEASFDLA